MDKPKFSFEAAGFDKQLEALIVLGRGKIKSRVSVKTENIKSLFHKCFDQAQAKSKFSFELKTDRDKALAAGGASIEDSLKRQKEIAAAALAKQRAALKAEKPEVSKKRQGKKPKAAPQKQAAAQKQAPQKRKRMNFEKEIGLMLKKQAEKKKIIRKAPAAPQKKKTSGLLSDRGAFKTHLHRERHWRR